MRLNLTSLRPATCLVSSTHEHKQGNHKTAPQSPKSSTKFTSCEVQAYPANEGVEGESSTSFLSKNLAGLGSRLGCESGACEDSGRWPTGRSESGHVLSCVLLELVRQTRVGALHNRSCAYILCWHVRVVPEEDGAGAALFHPWFRRAASLTSALAAVPTTVQRGGPSECGTGCT